MDGKIWMGRDKEDIKKYALKFKRYEKKAIKKVSLSGNIVFEILNQYNQRHPKVLERLRSFHKGLFYPNSLIEDDFFKSLAEY